MGRQIFLRYEIKITEHKIKILMDYCLLKLKNLLMQKYDEANKCLIVSEKIIAIHLTKKLYLEYIHSYLV